VQTGEYAVAESLMAISLRLMPGASLAIDEARILLGLIEQGLEMGQPALAYRAIGRLDALRNTLQAARPDQSLQAEFEIATADFLAGQGEFRLAREALDRAREAVETRAGEGKRWDYYRSVGELALIRGDLESAREAFAEALRQAEATGNPDQLARSRFHLGEILMAAGRFAEARDLFPAQPAEEAFGPRFRTRLTAAIFRAMTFSREGRHEEALTQFAAARGLTTHRSPPDLLARLDIEEGRSLAALKRWREAEDALRRARERLRGRGSGREVPELRAFGDDARRDATEILVGLYVDHPALLRGRPLGEQTLRLAEEGRGGVSGGLPSAEPLAAYFVGRERSFLWVGTDEAIDLHPLPGRRELRRRAQPVLADMTHAARAVEPRAASDLGNLLLGPVEPHWREGTTLHIVPDDFLFSIPWCALTLADGRAVIDHGPIRESPSRSATSPGPSPSALTLLAVGVDGLAGSGSGALRHAEAEARAVAALWPAGRSALRIGAEASGALTQGGFDVLHVASHAVVHQGLPSRASLRLAGLEGGTPVTIADLKSLRLDAELIYLSCCEGATRHAAGAGLLDFARAFMAAGVRTVIASTARVDDEASRYLAERFYRHWLAGEDKPAALRSAQLDVREARARWRHPYFWAFYRVIGSP